MPGSISLDDLGGQTAFLVTVVFFTATPLFQTRLLPLLMQVNFLPAEVDVAPAFEHLAPALVKAWTGVAPSKVIASRRIRTLRIIRINPNYAETLTNIVVDVAARPGNPRKLHVTEQLPALMALTVALV